MSPIISGGMAITGWQPDASIKGAWSAALPPGYQYFDQLWVNDGRRLRPRAASTSTTGYFTNMGPVYVSSATGCTNPNYTAGYSPAVRIDTGAQMGQYQCFDRFYYSPGDIQSGWAGLADTTHHPVQIIDFENWTIARLRLMSVDTTAKPYPIAYLTGTTVPGQPFFGFTSGHRYLIENLVDALTSNPEPGVWFLDEVANTLIYVPESGEDFSNAAPTVVAPQVGQLIAAQNLSNVTFSGLTFEHANWAVGPLGYDTLDGGQSIGSNNADGKAQPGVTAALSFSNTSNVTVEGCTIRARRRLGRGAHRRARDAFLGYVQQPGRGQSAHGPRRRRCAHR